jgi:hypothetical protein
MSMLACMVMAVLMFMIAFMFMLVAMRVRCVRVVVFEMNIELGARDAVLLLSRHMQMIAVQAKFPQFLLELARIQTKVEQRADEHVATDAAKQIQVKGLHAQGFRGGLNALRRECVNLACGIAGAEAVVDVHYRHATGATVEHAQ